MEELMSIGIIIIIAVILLRIFSRAPQPTNPPQVIYVQMVPQGQVEKSGNGVGTFIFLIIVIIAAITLFP